MPPICMHCISNSNTTNIINLTRRHNTHTSNSNTTNIINLTRRHNTHTIESFILTGSPHSWGHCYVPPGWVAYWLWWPSLPQVVAWDTCTNGVSYDCSFFFFFSHGTLILVHVLLWQCEWDTVDKRHSESYEIIVQSVGLDHVELPLPP